MNRWVGRWNDWPLGLKSAVVVALPVALLLGSFVSSYRLQKQVNAADEDVRRALVIQGEIQTLHTLLAESATGVRGYLLTGRQDFLAPYENARAAMPRTLDILRQSIRDPEVNARFQRFLVLLDRKFRSLEELRVDGREMAPADLQAHLIQSKAVLDELRTEVREMHARESELVAEYSTAARRAVQWNIGVAVATSLLMLLSAAAAFLLLFNGVVQRVKVLANNAERLANDEPLVAIAPGKDELGLLAERLQNASALLARRAAEARSASEAKTTFLSRTSHELRTPLNAILGFAQLLEGDLRGTPHSAQAEAILTAGRHLLALIDEVLDIARIESGELKLELEVLELLPLVEEAQGLTVPLAAQRKVEVVLKPAAKGEASGGTVLADRQRLRQVLLNLLSNAVKFNRSGGRVEIAVRTAADRCRVEIHDTGRGIPAEQLSRLFRPFERLQADQWGVEGTGLGLSVSRELVLQMGGDIEVTSQPGKGSVFAVWLPAARRAGATAAAAPHGAAPVAVAAPPRPARLLLIEDNASNLALVQALVARRPQWQLSVAQDGERGLQLAREVTPDLILLDLHLPGLGGEEVLAALQADPVLARIRVAVISADAMPGTIARVQAAGAAAYLTKPVDVQGFYALLDEAIR